MVKGKTKRGIKFQINEKIKDDARILYYFAKASNKNTDESEQADAVMGLMRLIFGSDEDVLQFMNAVAAVNDGVCDKDVMWAEIKEMLDAVNLKNSSSSPQ